MRQLNSVGSGAVLGGREGDSGQRVGRTGREGQRVCRLGEGDGFVIQPPGCMQGLSLKPHGPDSGHFAGADLRSTSW